MNRLKSFTELFEYGLLILLCLCLLPSTAIADVLDKPFLTLDEATYPDTLDLAERAELAINPLTSFADGNHNYASWWQANLGTNPVRMERTFFLYGKFTEALPLMRVLSGSTQNAHIDSIWRRQLKLLFAENKDAIIAHGPENGRYLVTLAILSLLDQKGLWEKMGQKMVDNTVNNLVDNGKWGYIPTSKAVMDEIEKGNFLTESWAATSHGWTLQGLSQFYRQTGYAPAKEAASKIAYYLKDHAGVFSSDGKFLAAHKTAKGTTATHFHHNGNCMEALSEYVLISGDKEIAEFVLKIYGCARSLSEPTVGFVPEYITWPDDRKVYDCEGCCVADMVATSLNLSLIGYDFWDDLDRYVRNMFSEMQMLDDKWLHEYSQSIEPTPVTKEQYADNVPRKLIGDFAGWCPYNEFYGAELAGIQHCCLGNCARAIYHVWLNIVHFDNNTLTVNLLLNHNSRWAAVKSMVPYNGRVEIIPKQNCALVVRIPEYVEPSQFNVLVNNEVLKTTITERWATIDSVKQGVVVNLEFPVPITQKKVTVGGVDYTLTIKGNVAADCRPQGKRYPFFIHPEYLTGEVVEKKVMRPVPATLPFLDGAVRIEKVNN